jgi:hypothetical protein
MKPFSAPQDSWSSANSAQACGISQKAQRNGDCLWQFSPHACHSGVGSSSSMTTAPRVPRPLQAEVTA